MIIIENDNNDNDSDNDNNCNSDNVENNDSDDNKLQVNSPPKGPMMLSFGVIFVESVNNSRVSSDSRCHVPHVTSLWCDIFMQHHHICIVECSYE